MNNIWAVWLGIAVFALLVGFVMGWVCRGDWEE